MELCEALPRVLIVSRRTLRKNKFVDFVGQLRPLSHYGLDSRVRACFLSLTIMTGVTAKAAAAVVAAVCHVRNNKSYVLTLCFFLFFSTEPLPQESIT